MPPSGANLIYFSLSLQPLFSNFGEDSEVYLGLFSFKSIPPCESKKFLSKVALLNWSLTLAVRSLLYLHAHKNKGRLLRVEERNHQYLTINLQTVLGLETAWEHHYLAGF